MVGFEVNSFWLSNALVDALLPSLSEAELKCYLYIVRKTRGWQKREDAISISQFVKGTGLSNRHIIKACNSLVAQGLIEQSVGARRVKVFAVLSLRAADPKVTGDVTSAVTLDRASDDLRSGLAMTDGHTQKDTTLKNTTSKDTASQDTVPADAILKNSFKNSDDSAEHSPSVVPKVTAKASSKPSSKSALRSRAKTEMQVQFERFWLAYPRKQAKQEALRAYLKIAPDADLLAQMMTAVAACRGTAEWMADCGKYIPHAATWLNGRRWEDELMVAAGALVDAGGSFDQSNAASRDRPDRPPQPLRVALSGMELEAYRRYCEVRGELSQAAVERQAGDAGVDVYTWLLCALGERAA